MISVSVAMPVRNAERTIAEAIRSLLVQTWSDFEFIVVDHRSTDSTPEILAELARGDDRLRILHCDGTFIEAANLAWRSTRGDLIARMDADDVAYPERLTRQVTFLEENSDLAACGTRVRIVKRDADGRILPPDGGFARYGSWLNSLDSPERISAERFVESPIANPSAMMRREVIKQLGGYRECGWAEDYDFWLRLLESGHRLGNVDDTVLDWIDSPGRATRTDERYELERSRRAKAYFLSRIDLVRTRGVIVCGAGPVGKSMVRCLREAGIAVTAYCEVNERQIGNRIGGIPVLGPEGIEEFHRKTVLLAAVGQPGARDRIRALAQEAGYTEGDDFFCAA